MNIVMILLAVFLVVLILLGIIGIVLLIINRRETIDIKILNQDVVDETIHTRQDNIKNMEALSFKALSLRDWLSIILKQDFPNPSERIFLSRQIKEIDKYLEELNLYYFNTTGSNLVEKKTEQRDIVNTLMKDVKFN